MLYSTRLTFTISRSLFYNMKKEREKEEKRGEREMRKIFTNIISHNNVLFSEYFFDAY